MNWLAIVRTALARHRAPDDEVVEEIAQHAAASFESARAEGLSSAEAEARVRGLVETWCAQAPPRRPRRPPTVEPPASTTRGWTGLGQDFKYGLRRLVRQPGFALIAIVLIALGVGAAATLGHVTYSVLVKPLGWPDADRLVLVSEEREGQKRKLPGILTNATYLSWRDQPTTLESIGGYSTRMTTLSIGEGAERVRVASATASVFDVLRARPLVGQIYTAAAETAGNDHVIVISHGLWERRFAARADAIGQSVELDGDRFRIIGVMPPAFAFPNKTTQAWTPMRVPPVVGSDPAARSISLFRAIGRLREGASAEQAASEGTARGHAAPSLGLVGTAVFGTQGLPRVSATPYLESLVADVRPALVMLLWAVGLLLVAAIANVAGMQLARATSRRREVAIRASLGAGPGRIARQMVAENLVVGVLGGLSGWLLSLALQGALPQLLPSDFPRADDMPSDWRVFVVAMTAGVAASLLFGALPALLARRINLVESLVEDSLAPVGGRLRSAVGRVRAGIMVGQVGVATVLLLGAALLGQSFLALLKVDRGYNPHNLLTATLPMPDRQFKGPQRAAALDTIIERVKQLPGVTFAAGSSIMPLLQYDQPMAFQMPPGDGRREAMNIQADLRTISSDYFNALGIHIVEGRGFTDADTLTSAPVILVNRAFVRAYLREPVVGTRLPISFNQGDSQPQQTIVGVVDDVHQQGATDPPKPEIFNTYRQLTGGMTMPAPVILARTSGNPSDIAGPFRALVHDVNASIAVDSLMTMDDRLLTSLARPRLYAVLLAAFGVLALLVAGAGLFGVLSYSVAQRSREIGVRAALGARRGHIIRLVVGQGLLVTGAGLLVGLGAATALVRYVGTLLYGVTVRDPWSYVFVAGALLVVAAGACLVPAVRAVRIDPIRVLKGI